MDFEQKYNEALERAKKFEEKYGGDYAGYIFPELAESEDERIRKKMIEHFKSKTKDTWCNMPVKSILAWLEKQKEQKPAESISRLTVQGKGVYKICPRCKGRMVRDDSKVYTSMPPQYRYECPKCGESECDTVMYDNPEMEEQKPDWSEEDEHMLEWVCRIIHLNHIKNYTTSEDETKLTTWLKSLRPQKQDNNISISPERLKELRDKSFEDGRKAGVAEMAKSMPMPEDTVLFQNGVKEGRRLEREEMWKPSEEQLKALIDCTIGNEYDVHALVRLWAELKKL